MFVLGEVKSLGLFEADMGDACCDARFSTSSSVRASHPFWTLIFAYDRWARSRAESCIVSAEHVCVRDPGGGPTSLICVPVELMLAVLARPRADALIGDVRVELGVLTWPLAVRFWPWVVSRECSMVCVLRRCESAGGCPSRCLPSGDGEEVGCSLVPLGNAASDT
jgi:hypothetical protein